jgi:endonuclease G
VPRIDDQGRVLTTDGAIWDRVDSNRVAWISNEGIRIEKIVAWLQGQRVSLPEEARALLDAALQGTMELPAHVAKPTPRPKGRELVPQGTNAKPTPSSPPSESRVTTAMPGKVRETAPAPQPLEMRWVIPLEVTVRVLPPTHASAPGPAVSAQVSASGGVPDATEALTFDPDYSNRGGYDSDWLDGVSVPFPKLTAAQRKLASWDRERPGDADRHVLRYHHFSVVHHHTRRLPWVTAVNTTRDPALRGKSSRKAIGTDRWIRDDRVPPGEQITDDELYKGTPFDLGHLVMRLDAYWGEDEDRALRANADTFHYTNCTPQHTKFNQEGKVGIWGALEAHISGELKSAVPSLSIFAGPVLADDDPEFRGVKIPRRFWKVVAGLDDDGALAAFGFVLSQQELLRDMGVEAFSPGRFEVYQVPITEIEAMSGITLPKVLRDADQGPEAEESVEAFRPLKRRAKR